MTKLQLEIHDDVLAALDKIRNLDDHGIELIIPEGSILFDNILNLKLLDKEADKLDKTLHFTTTDRFGQNLISEINNEESGEEFSVKEISEEEIEHIEEPKPKNNNAKFRKRKAFASISTGIKTKKGKLFKILVILGILLGIGTYGAVYALQTVPKANVKVIVNSQPLTKSVQIKVVKDGETNASLKTLKGYQVDSLVTVSETTETTGEKLIGDKAKGKIRIYNKTSSEKEFDKGHIVRYEDDDVELEFELDKDVTVPERTEDPDTLVITPGEATVEVTARIIGEEYNIDDNKDLEVDDEDNDDFTAKTEDDFEGGKSETVKIVAEEDITKLTQQALEKGMENIEDSLVNKASTGKEYIKGSYETQVTKEEYSHEAEEETDTLEINQEILVTGLAYSKGELENLLEDLVDELIPEGYTLSSQDKEIKVEVLGNTDSTIASPAEADLQVTIKAFVITIIDQESLKDQLTNKPLTEAQKILGGIKNIQTYELNVSPNIPFLQKMPTNKENINLSIEKQ